MPEKQDDLIYCTTYCNRGHFVQTGRPVDHECYIIPPKALQAEMAGDFDRATEIMQSRKLRITRGRKRG